ncbi:MAG: RsmE family RNA methyltransferase [Phycisphaerales bacterium]|jgi:16S rRNA (uracil1498-N3)-methyltransferase
MAAPRFILASIPAEGQVAWLDREEARHALGSRRLGPGDPVDLVDGHGTVAEARLEAERDRDGNLAVRVGQVRHVSRPMPALHVASAVPKGDRLGSLLDAVGELAVESLTPLDCRHSVTPADRVGGERSRRILAEAMKQSRGAWLTRIEPPATPQACATASVAAGHRVLLLDPRGRPLADQATGAASMVLLAGPEGGFGESELVALRDAGALPASLGATVLRVELAVAAACGAIRAMHPA